MEREKKKTRIRKWEGGKENGTGRKREREEYTENGKWIKKT